MSLLGYLVTLPLFGGEDPLAPAGTTWHHENLTREAATISGWSGQAANSLAFHADCVDSYLYNPLWWIQGGLARARVAIASSPELTKLHFDDLFSTGRVLSMWRRYTSGAVAGILWAAKGGISGMTPQGIDLRVSVVHNIVGASLHAIQDFYSHSNWLDEPKRRAYTFFDMPERERSMAALWTGYYEQPASLGMKPHGKIYPICNVFDNAAVKAVMRVVCRAESPLSESPLCGMFDRCQSAVDAQPERIAGVRLPPHVFTYEPGIALDTKWQAAVAVRERGLTGIDGDSAFELAKDLALRSSVQWLEGLEAAMTDVGLGDFWGQVKTVGAPFKTDTEPWERFDLMPYRFMTVGTYPPNVGDGGDGWFAHITITTSAEALAGTDADIAVLVDGHEFPRLEFAPHRNPLVAHNDFERGNTASYLVGPLDRSPSVIFLSNNARRESTSRHWKSLGSAWKVGSVRVVGFCRGSKVHVVGYEPVQLEQWLRAGQSLEVALTRGQTHTANVPGQGPMAEFTR